MGRVYESLNRDFRNRSIVYIGVRGCKRAFTTRKYSKRGSIYARSAPSIKRRETIWNGGVSRSQGKGRRLYIEGGGNREGLKRGIESVVISTKVARFLEATGVSGDKIIISLLSFPSFFLLPPFSTPFFHSPTLSFPFSPHTTRRRRGGRIIKRGTAKLESINNSNHAFRWCDSPRAR